MAEIELKTAPADFRFPTTNQTRHCFTRYIEFHRCLAAKGENSGECERFAKYYRSLCPGEWIGVIPHEARYLLTTLQYYSITKSKSNDQDRLLKGGMNRGRMGLFQDLFEIMWHLDILPRHEKSLTFYSLQLLSNCE
ncbi:Cytochrome c oxidase subunit 6b-3 [Glycine max]|nr:Cytochrome c oxidase subunit 6b-3 [Glycine max]